MNVVKKFNWGNALSILIFITIVGTSVSMHVQLADVHTILVEQEEVPKITITDNDQFAKLCEQLSKQWGADGYAFYILQPKGIQKTYKEQAITSDNMQFLPLRTKISNTQYQRELQTKRFVNLTRTTISLMLVGATPYSTDHALVLPVYQHNAIVGEFYMFYDKDINTDNIQNQISEAQVFSKLLY